MHLLFNIIGTVIFSIVAIVFFEAINPAAGIGPVTQTEISMAADELWITAVTRVPAKIPRSGFCPKVTNRLVNSSDSFSGATADDIVEIPMNRRPKPTMILAISLEEANGLYKYSYPLRRGTWDVHLWHADHGA